MVSETVQGYLNGPASIPPDGATANLDDPPYHGTGPLVLLVVCLVLTLLASLGRAYSRLFVLKRLQVEDYLGLLALLSYIIIVYSFLRYWVNVGFFIHMWDLRGADLVETSYVGFIINIGYCLVLLFSKSAILLEWVRIFVPKGTRNTFWWSARVMMAANICLYTSGVIVVFAGCQPLQLFWNFWLSGHCVDRKARDTANAAFNVLLDVIILILPQPVIWRLHMTNTRKLGICVVFSVGLLAIVTAVGRLHGIITMDYPTDLTHVFDTSYQFSIELEWIIAELTCVMLVFCVPALPKMISERTVLFTSRFTDLWRSWTRLGRSSRASDSRDNDLGWKEFSPRPTGHVPGSRQRIMDEELLITGDDEQVNVLTLAAMRDHYTMSHGIGGPKGDQEHTEPGIVKTIEFDRYDHNIHGPSSNLHHEPPRAWMKK